MAIKLVRFISTAWAWMPIQFTLMIGMCVLIKFGDSLFGIIDRAWKVIGR